MSKLNNYGFLSLLYSISDNPLGLWSKHVSSDGRIRRLEDENLNGDRVIEIIGPEDSPIRTCISCPANREDCLDIQLPVLVIVIKNLKSKIQIVFQLIDAESIRRKFILSTSDNAKSTITEIETAKLPLKLDEGWNILEINLETLCRSIYRTEYRALQRLIIYPNCRLRRVYLQNRHYENNETPVELCQAFFDMYMLKWGIHFVEKSCQTIETLEDVKNASEEMPVSISENSPRPSMKVSTSKQSTLINRPRTKESSIIDINVNSENKRKSTRIEAVKKGVVDNNENESNLNEIPSISMKIMNDNEGEIFRKWPYKYLAPRKSMNSAHTRSIRSADTTKDHCTVNALSNAFLHKKNAGYTHSANASSRFALIPSEVEAASVAATKNIESTKSKLLTTDEAIGDFLELRHVINRKMLENFRIRGLTMTEVELSIYNSKNRKNSYGQGKLVKKHRTTVDKGCHVCPSKDIVKNEKKQSAAR